MEIVDINSIDSKIHAYTTEDTMMYSDKELKYQAFCIPTGTEVILLHNDLTTGSAQIICNEYSGWVVTKNLKLD